METEEWRPVAGWPEYEVSSLGRVRRAVAARGFPAGYLMTAAPDKNGYPRVGLSSPGRKGCPPVHRLVAIAFLPPPGRGRWQVAHNDGRPGNNVVSNLRWATVRENQHDRRRHGTQTLGEGHPNAKLTEAEVRSIRETASGRALRQVAERFGVSISTISDVVNRKAWAHVA